jgi:cobalt/nickel transport system permease protein
VALQLLADRHQGAVNVGRRKIVDTPYQTPKGKPRSGFIERTLVDINNTLEHSVFSEKTARQKGALQKLDPRLKLISLLLILLAVNLSHQLWVIVGLYALALLLGALSAVPMLFFVRRVWILMPFFTGLVALPAIFITPGPALVGLPLGLVITRTGLMTALLLVLRVGTSVSFAVLLILTTPWNSVLKALGILRVPDVVVLMFGMTYRYLHLLLHAADDMVTARKSRILRRLTGAEDRRLLAAMSGALLGKSLKMSEDVYLAMESRGFRGYPRTMDRFRMKWFDWIAGGAVLVVSIGAFLMGR